MIDAARLAAALAAHGAVARVALAEVRGSTPREAGAEMLVWEGGFDGTIGGGALEWRALALARAALADGRPRVERVPLGPALAQCCGGAVVLAVERFAAVPADWPHARRLEGDRPRPPGLGWRDGWLIEPRAEPRRALWVWGAGHVGRAIVDVVAPLPDIAVTWVDVAPERFPDPLPPGALVAADPPRAMPRAPRDAEHLILTHSHDIDLALCHAALGHGFRACGLIGSATKGARFRSRLRALGHADAAISRILCPIGDPALGKHPRAIAIGVAAQLLKDGGAEGAAWASCCESMG